MKSSHTQKDYNRLNKKELIIELNYQQDELVRLKKVEQTRNQVEEAFLKSEANLRAILDSTHASYSLYDENYNIVAFNNVCKNSTMMFKDIDLKIGMSMHDIIKEPSEIKAVQEKFDKAMDGEIIKFQRHIRDQIHGEYWFEISYSPIFIGGKVKGVTLCNNDITERKTAELELERHRDHLEELVQERTAELLKVNDQLKSEIADKIRAEELLRIQRDLSINLGSTYNLNQAFESISNSLMGVDEIDCCSVYLVNLENGSMEMMAFKGCSPQFAESIRNFSPDDQQTKIVRKGKSLFGVNKNIKWCKDFGDEFESLEAIGIIPIFHEGIVIAAALVGSHVYTKFSKSSLDAMQAIAAHIGGVITRLNIEEELKRNEELYRTLVETSPDAIVLTDMKGIILKFNQQATQLFGYTDLSVLQNEIDNLFKVITPLDRKSKITSCEELFQVENHEFEVIKQDRTSAVVEINASYILDADNEPKMMMGILRDITDRKKAEELAKRRQEQLVQAGKMITIGTLVSGIAHEINNPNNFIMLNTPIVKKCWESAKPVLDQNYDSKGDFEVAGAPYSAMQEMIPGLIDDILEGSRRIKNIVMEMKDFVKMESYQVRENLDIDAAVKSALTLTNHILKKSTNDFCVDIARDLPVIVGTQQRLESVLINLLENACHALTDKSQAISLRVFTDEKKCGVFFEVEDQGRGISDEAMPQIMDPFFTTRRDSGGTGLGLYISLVIINEMGGDLTVSSSVGKGTKIKVIIPSQDKIRE